MRWLPSRAPAKSLPLSAVTPSVSLPVGAASTRRPVSLLVGAAAFSAAAAPSDVYAIPIQTLDGQTTTLAEFKDDLLLIVNVASA